MSVVAAVLGVLYLIGFIACAPLTWIYGDFGSLIDSERDEMMAGATVIMWVLLALCIGLIWPVLLVMGVVLYPITKLIGRAIKATDAEAPGLGG